MNTTTSIRKKFDRALTLLLALAVIVGSVHWALGEADNELPDGVFAQELLLMQGDPDFDPAVDIYDNISYPEDRYTNLRVADWAGFDINELGEYELTYALDRMPAVQPTQPDGPQTPDTEQPGAGSGGNTNTEQPGAGSNDNTNTENSGAGSGDNANTENSGAGGVGTTESTAPDKNENGGAADTTNSGESAEEQSDHTADSKDSSDAAAEAEAQADDSDSVIESHAAADTPAVSTEANPAGKTEGNADENTANKTEAGADESTANKNGTATDAPSTGAAETVYFKRTVIVMDPADMEEAMPAAIIEGEINDGYPWGSAMSESSVTLHVPREGYNGAIALKRTNAPNLSAEKVNELGVDYVTVATNVTGGKVTISGSQLVDGAWYRFEYEDNAVSNPVRLVKGGANVYRGATKIPFSRNNEGLTNGYWISNDNIMYTVGKHVFSGYRTNDFTVAGVITTSTITAWTNTSYAGYFTLSGSSVNAENLKPMRYDETAKIQVPQLKEFRFNFQSRNSRSISCEIVPDETQNKHISIAADTCFGSKVPPNKVAQEADEAALSKIINRKDAKMQLVGVKNIKDANATTPAFSISFDQGNLPERTVIGYYASSDVYPEEYRQASFLWANNNNNCSVSNMDSGMSMSWLDLDKKKDPTIRFTFSIGTYSELGSVADTVVFDRGSGQFVQEDGKDPKTSFLFYNDEVLGTTKVLNLDSSQLVLEKIPQCKPSEDTANAGKAFVGWTLKVSGTADTAIDLNKVYSDTDIQALRYKDMYGTMTFTAHYAETEAEVYSGDTPKGKYGSAALALAAAKNGETVKLLKNADLTPAENAELKNGVSIQQKDGNTVKATANGTYINVAADGAITLCTGENQKDGAISVSHKTADSARTVTVDGYTLSTTHDYTVKAVDTGSRAHDSKASVTLTQANLTVKVTKGDQDYCTFTSGESERNFYIGGYNVTLDWRSRTKADSLPSADEQDNAAAAKLKTAALPYYKQNGYTMTIVPEGNYTFTNDTAGKVYVSMEGENGAHTMLTKTKDFTVTKKSDKELTVEIKNSAAITGALRCYMGPVGNQDLLDHAMTKLTVTLKADADVTGSKPGTVTVHALGKEYKLAAKADEQGVVEGEVPLGEPLSLTFAPTDFSLPYYQEFTKEEGSTFSLLTALTADGGADAGGITYDLTKPAQKKDKDAAAKNGGDAPGASFDWVPKAYTVEYTAKNKTADGGTNKLEATFTKSHVFRVFLTGGSVTVTKPDNSTDGLIHRDHDEVNEDSHYIIVKDGTPLKVTMKRTTQAADQSYFNAYWAKVENKTQSKGVDLPDANTKLTNLDGDAGKGKIYETPVITEPFILNAAFEQGQPVTVKVTGGKVLNALPKDFAWDEKQDGTQNEESARVVPIWTEQGGTYTAKVDHGKSIFVLIEPDKGLSPKRATTDGLTFEGDELKQLLQKQTLVKHENGGKTYYIYRSNPIYRAWNAELLFAKEATITFTDGKDTLATGETNDQKIRSELFEQARNALKTTTGKFFAWVAQGVDTAVGKITQIYTELTEVLSDLILQPVYRDQDTQTATGKSGSIAAAGMTISPEIYQNIANDKQAILEVAKAEVFDAVGKPVAYTSDALQAEWSDALKPNAGAAPTAGLYQNGLTISLGEGQDQVSVSISVRILSNEQTQNPVITGKTAHALRFTGKAKTKYQIVLTADQTHAVIQNVTTDENGSGTFTGLDKNTTYTIADEVSGFVTDTTLLVDAEEIAKKFANGESDKTTPNNQTGATEAAENSNVKVTVGADNNYRITLKQDIQRTVAIPDTWENVTLDLVGHTIKGADAVAETTADGGKENGDAGADGQTGGAAGENGSADAENSRNGNTVAGENGKSAAAGQDGGAAGTAQSAAPGLRFIKDANAPRNPGTTLTVINGTIQGGNGVTGVDSMNGAAGVETATETNAPTNAKIIVGKDAKILGGSGANAKDNSGQNGGNGGVGIQGNITVTVLEGGSVKGGNGGNGANVIDGAPAGTIVGQGGKGGQGTEPDVTTVAGAPEGSIINGTAGQPGTAGETPPQPPQEDDKHTVIFDKNGTEQSFIVKAGEALGETFDQMVTWAEKGGKKLLAWVDNVKNKVYTKFTKIVEQVKLTSLFYDGEVARSADGSYTIAAKAFTVGKADLQTLTDGNLKELAKVQGYDKDGSWLTNDEIQVTGLDALKNLTEDKILGKHENLISFSIGTEPNTATVKVDVTITDAETTIPVSIIGTTAHTLTIQGRANTTYNVQYADNQTPAGTVSTNDNGVGTTAHLAERNTSYTIVNQNKPQEKVTGSTALVDAKLIAERFANQGETTNQTLTQDGNDETATNSNVTVTRGADGNYTAALRKAIQGTIAIPDTWGTVTLDLNQHTIQGADATDAVKAQVGLIFIADDDESIHVHPGTTLKVINGTIRGGSGNANYPNGAPAVSTAMNNARMTAAPTNAKIEVGNDAKLIGGQGANAAKNSSQHGGDGGAGITGTIEMLVSGGTVKGGDGGNGADADIEAAKPGNGGSGGVGTNVKKVTLQSGAILGGNGGKGGKASGGNKNPGGTGGAGGDGTAGGGESNNNGGNISGGAGGAGGDSSTGNGGQGGQGGNAGNNNNTGGGTENGGNGGNGGSSDKGDGGAGGGGGNSNTGNAGAGGNGGGSNTGNGGQGGNGGNSNSGNAGTGGTGGNSNTGQGGNGGNGGQGQKPGAGGNGGTGNNGANNGSSGKPGGSTGGSTGGGSGSTGGGTTTKPGGTTTKPGGTTTKPGDSTTTKPGGTTTKPGGTTTKPSGTTTKPSGTTTKPSGSTSKPSSSTSKPSGSTSKPSGSTNGSGNTAANGSMNGNGNGYNSGNGYDYNNGNGSGNGYDNNNGNGYNSSYGNGYDYDYSNGYGDGSVPAGSDQWTDANGAPVDFWHCTYHWSPLLLLGGLAGYALVRVMQIRGILRRKKQEA